MDKKMTIEKLTLDHPESKSADITEGNIQQLKLLFPDVFSEGKIDFEALKTALGEAVDDSDERYNFTWNGKNQARQIAQTPSTGTLRPCKEESVNWDSTDNLFIEGDNLEVLKLLQKSYHKKVKMIYIDPPYNTGKDFVYKDNFHNNINNYLEITGQVDGEGRKLSTNSDSSGRYHSDWLNMLYPRLKLARNLLKDDGVIFISIDDYESDNIKKLCNEIFGEDNFLTTLIWNKQHSQQQGLFKRYHEYVHVYAKNVELHDNISGGEGEINAGALKKISKANPESEFQFPAGVRIETQDYVEFTGTYGDSEKVTVTSGRFIADKGVTIEPVTLSAGWTQKEQMKQYFDGKEVYDTKGQRVLEFYFSKTGKLKCRKARTKITPSSLLPEYGMVSAQSKALKSLLGFDAFDNPKPVEMIKDFSKWFTSNTDIILDFFAGSATTAQAIFELNLADGGNRRFITVQLPESCNSKPEALERGYVNIAEISRARIIRSAEKIISNTNDYHGDLGLKVFKLDETNIQSWDTDFENLEPALRLAAKSIKEDRTSEDVLYEILLKYGLELTETVEETMVEGKKVFVVGDGALMVCLDDGITEAVVEGIAKLKQELDTEVTQVVFKDQGFADSVVKTNAIQILKQYDIDDVKSI